MLGREPHAVTSTQVMRYATPHATTWVLNRSHPTWTRLPIRGDFYVSRLFCARRSRRVEKNLPTGVSHWRPRRSLRSMITFRSAASPIAPSLCGVSR